MKVAIYVRVSTHHQIDKDSLPLQRKELKNYCKFILNTDNYVIFEDAGFSGKNTDRPKYQEMLSRIKNREFSHILVWKIDRISRNLLDFCDMYEELKKYKCTFISKNEQFDTSSAMGEAMLKIILVFAELERKLTAERVTAVMLDRASKGLWNGAPIPLGYRWDENIKFPVIDEIESETVKLIYSLYLSKQSTTYIRNYLNTNSIKTKRNGTWTTKTISDIIRNPFYKGTYRYNYKQPANGAKKDKKEWIILENNHPGIIEENIWQQCNDIMDKNAERNNSKFRENTKTHIFSGLLECGECHNSLYAKQDKPNLDGYVPSLYCCTGRYNKLGCEQKTTSEKIIGEFVFNYMSIIIKTSQNHNKINMDEFERTILNNKTLNNIIAIDGLSEVYRIMVRQETNNFERQTNVGEIDRIEIDQLKKEKAKYDRAMQRLEDLYLFDDEAISEKNYLIKKNRITEKLIEIEDKIKKHMKKHTTVNETFISLATNRILNDILLNDEKIDTKSLINRVGRNTLKEFVNETLDKVIVKDKKVIGIRFKNGIENKFIYS